MKLPIFVFALTANGLDARGIKATSVAHVRLNKMANHAGRIVPPLEDVASDKKFFGPPFPADYPHDTQPHASKEVFQKGQPYPSIQEQGFFDKDYVKDENSDGGEWHAQMEYDNARTRVDRTKQHVDQVKKKAHTEAHDVEEAAKRYKASQTKEQQAANAAKTAEETEEIEQHKEDEARHHVEEKEAAAKAKVETAKQDAADAQKSAERRKEATKVLEERVDDAKNALSTERESFKDCQKELDEAKAKVEKLMKQKDELSQTEDEESTVLLKERRLVEEQERILREERAKTVAAETGRDSALSKLGVSRNETEASRKELARQQAEQAVAEKKLKKETQELEEADKELADARTQLRKRRGQDALPAGEFVNTTKPVKSRASRMTMGLVAAVLLLLAVSS